MNTFFYSSVLILTGMLLFPVSKIIWINSVRRLEKRLERRLSEEERAGQKRRARVVAILLILPFSWLFNMHLLGGA